MSAARLLKWNLWLPAMIHNLKVHSLRMGIQSQYSVRCLEEFRRQIRSSRTMSSNVESNVEHVGYVHSAY
jgi:hypothetical protein